MVARDSACLLTIMRGVGPFDSTDENRTDSAIDHLRYNSVIMNISLCTRQLPSNQGWVAVIYTRFLIISDVYPAIRGRGRKKVYRFTLARSLVQGWILCSQCASDD